MDEKKIRQVLSKAYFEKENREIPNRWQQNVMNRIRILEHSNNKLDREIGFSALFEQYLWKFAPIACVLALILSIYIFQADFQAEYEMAKLFIDDPLEFNLIQSFGIL